MRTQRRNVVALAALAAALLLAGAVRAGEHERDEEHEGREHHRRGERGRERREPEREGPVRLGGGPRILPAYATECGACHLAYPPDLLPAASWTKLMASLDRHFGQNAELDDEGRATLERWLVERAGRDGGERAPLRITERTWFRREHRKVQGAAARPQVGSLANCAACHPGAERWDFEEDRVKIPRG